jgi:hypothetical protein
MLGASPYKVADRRKACPPLWSAIFFAIFSTSTEQISPDSAGPFTSFDPVGFAIFAFQTALTWPETQRRIQALLKRGLQREGEFENRWPSLLGTLLET